MNQLDLHGRTAVVTGGARGIGRAIAERMLASGAAVALWDLDAAALDATAAELSQHGLVSTHQVELTDEDAVRAAADATLARHGALDILVNNAGITRDNLLYKMGRTDWDAVISTNLTSIFLCCQAASVPMVAAKYGKIVSLSSRSALGNRGQVNYAAAKAGVQGITATLAIELGRYNINVNAVAPGFIATAMTAATAQRVGFEPAEYQKLASEQTPLGRVGQPEEVASVIAFLASDEASYVSGQTLYINGGDR